MTASKEETFTAEKVSGAVQALKEEAGRNAYVSLAFTAHESGSFRLGAVLYPEGVCGTLRFDANHESSPLEAIRDVRAQWLKGAAARKNERTRKMALAVIDLTERLGDCTDSALRGRDFTQAEIDDLGPGALRLAESMAAGGPFKIVETVGANSETKQEAVA